LLFDQSLKTFEINDKDKSFGVQKSLVLIKPDIVKSQKIDTILDRIICKGFSVTKREELTLSAEQVRDLYPKMKNELEFVADLTRFFMLLNSVGLY
jgi:nucleoside diphosphate kinase